MQGKKVVITLSRSLHFVALVLVMSFSCATAAPLTEIERLGKAIFFDKNLSINGNQACAACHAPEVGWTGPDQEINAHGAVYEGSIEGRFGDRRAPSVAYATPSPVLHAIVEEGEVLFIGGNFYDGRATGEHLGNPAADQAQGPFLNPFEQALPDKACVVYKVCKADYPIALDAIWPGLCDIDWPDKVDKTCAQEQQHVALSEAERVLVNTAYDDIALAIKAYEASPEVNRFSSKFDRYLAGEATLTKQEQRGLELFEGKALCANCHLVDGKRPLLTDFTYDNLGVPSNPENPWFTSAFNPQGDDWVDEGLGGFLASRVLDRQFARENIGKYKVPTLRNVDKRPSAGFVKAYMHNGYFKTLEGIVNFYNTRDTKPRCEDLGIHKATEKVALANECWPNPEIEANVNTDELGNLGLTPREEQALVAFMKTLSDEEHAR